MSVIFANIKIVIKRKLKKCSECGKDTYLFSKGRCKPCAYKSYTATKFNHVRLKEDAKFYTELWGNNVKFCMNCNARINATTLHDKRWCSHHILPKSKYPQFRYDSRNIAILCKDCHAMAESSVSYPKMNIYLHLENIKLILLKDEQDTQY